MCPTIQCKVPRQRNDQVGETDSTLMTELRLNEMSDRYWGWTVQTVSWRTAGCCGKSCIWSLREPRANEKGKWRRPPGLIYTVPKIRHKPWS